MQRGHVSSFYTPPFSTSVDPLVSCTARKCWVQAESLSASHVSLGLMGPCVGTSIAVAIGQTLLMASLAEYCGIWPTAGGQQFYMQVLSSAKWRPLLSYLVGWALMTAEMSVSASCALNNADIITSFVSLVYPALDWQDWMTFVLYLAMITIPLLMNLLPSLLPAYSSFGAFLTIGGFFAWALTLLVMAPKSSAAFVFTTFLNNTGYSSSGWVFIMSFYNAMYGLYGTDAMMHLVEEMRNAARDAPVRFGSLIRIIFWVA